MASLRQGGFASIITATWLSEKDQGGKMALVGGGVGTLVWRLAPNKRFRLRPSRVDDDFLPVM